LIWFASAPGPSAVRIGKGVSVIRVQEAGQHFVNDPVIKSYNYNLAIPEYVRRSVCGPDCRSYDTEERRLLVARVAVVLMVSLRREYIEKINVTH
jgi:hypothetical protein